MGELASPKMAQMWCSFLLVFIIITLRVHGQQNSSQQGFISIDCGITQGDDYTDPTTNIIYNSDAKFIDTGENQKLQSYYSLQQSTLRSFPNGTRNCYNLKPVVMGRKYLVRATFLYGNYDGNNSASEMNPLQFDLYLGTNRWLTVSISGPSQLSTTETISVASDDFIWVCLVDTGHGTPFISSLELRPLRSFMYSVVDSNYTLVLYNRLDMGAPQQKSYRFPSDEYDRIWRGFSPTAWASSSTNSTINNDPTSDPFVVPSAVLQTASKPKNGSELNLYWNNSGPAGQPGDQFHCFLHFAEIESLSEQRTFDVFLNDKLLSSSYTPPYLESSWVRTVRTTVASKLDSISLKATNTSGAPPILNALETYRVMPFDNMETDASDVHAIMAIKIQYLMKRNWMGDPCAPRIYAWDGLNCSYNDPDPPRITTLNLSSSGLTEISASIADLEAIVNLDLSNNNITGALPDFLAALPSLHFLNLADNQLNGSIPPALLTKEENGELTLSIHGNPSLCNNVSCESIERMTKKKNSVLIITPVSVFSIVVLLLMVFIVWRFRRRKQHVSTTMVKPQIMKDEDFPLQTESRQFTYKELEMITKNFEREIGVGGFGTVYHGYLENGNHVAVKLRSQSSSQGIKEFLAEAQLLTRVHHKNLVSLVGYCKDGIYMALVYEHMAQGSLHDHLRGKANNARVLSWGERLRIAVEAGQGLEYLHKGCSPPIVHRDVKASNILLTHSLEAKLADFGLSKAFHSDSHTHVSTAAVVGTLGYLDPEYHYTLQLSEKSDVFGFGVVLLVMITGKPAVLVSPETGHLSQWMRTRLERGNITSVVDPRLCGEYDVNSIWKIAEVALSCTTEASAHRPTMGEVLVQLREGLALEVSRRRGRVMKSGAEETTDTTSFEIAHMIKMPAVSEAPAAR